MACSFVRQSRTGTLFRSASRSAQHHTPNCIAAFHGHLTSGRARAVLRTGGTEAVRTRAVQDETSSVEQPWAFGFQVGRGQQNGTAHRQRRTSNSVTCTPFQTLWCKATLGGLLGPGGRYATHGTCCLPARVKALQPHLTPRPMSAICLGIKARS